MTESRIIAALVIPPDQPPHIAAVTPDLEIYQHLVGGYIEAVILDDGALFCNEDGKASRLAPNRNVTILAKAASRHGLRDDDFIVGTAVVVGIVEPDTGRRAESEYDVPARFLELCDLLGFPVSQPGTPPSE